MRAMRREVLSSSEARDAILSSNEHLRGLVSETMRVADGAIRSDRRLEPMRTYAKDLYAAVAEHIELEEQILSTALGDVIGLGSALRAQIEKDHERQRAALASAMSALDPDDPSDARLVEYLRGFADKLLRDLDSEEKYLLTADVDALSIDSHGG
jgi:Hemerythrin HHE cation binding domain